MGFPGIPLPPAVPGCPPPPSPPSPACGGLTPEQVGGQSAPPIGGFTGSGGGFVVIQHVLGVGTEVGTTIDPGIGTAIGAVIDIAIGIFSFLFGGQRGLDMKQSIALTSAVNRLAKQMAAMFTFMNFLGNIVGILVSVVKDLLTRLEAIVSTIWNALKKLGLSKIYHWLQMLFCLYQRLHSWLEKYVICPLKQEEAFLLELYNTYILPIVKLMNDLERLTQIIGIFDKKLAAKIDQALWNLELKITSPILRAMQRVNVMASYIEAMLTLGGYFDRLTQLSSIWRDAGLIRSILHNPYQQQVTIGAPAPEIPLNIQVAPFVQYLKSGDGPWADDINTDGLHLQQYLTELQ